MVFGVGQSNGVI